VILGEVVPVRRPVEIRVLRLDQPMAQRVDFLSSCARRSDDTDAFLISARLVGYRASVEPEDICRGPAEAEVEWELSR
jgi:hypothetical protein